MKRFMIVLLLLLLSTGCVKVAQFDQTSKYDIYLKSGEIDQIQCQTHSAQGCVHGFNDGDDGTYIIICGTTMYPLEEITKVTESKFPLRSTK